MFLESINNTFTIFLSYNYDKLTVITDLNSIHNSRISALFSVFSKCSIKSLMVSPAQYYHSIEKIQLELCFSITNIFRVRLAHLHALIWQGWLVFISVCVY